MKSFSVFKLKDFTAAILDFPPDPQIQTPRIVDESVYEIQAFLNETQKVAQGQSEPEFH